jgi:hypothetical protein
MSDTLESMQQRLGVVERELADVRERLRLLTPAEQTQPSQNVRGLREAQFNQIALAAMAKEVFAKMGITSESVTAEQAQQRMLAEGVRPEDNAFSRDIRAMREE